MACLCAAPRDYHVLLRLEDSLKEFGGAVKIDLDEYTDDWVGLHLGERPCLPCLITSCFAAPSKRAARRVPVDRAGLQGEPSRDCACTDPHLVRLATHRC